MKIKKANEYENPVLEQQMNVDVSSELKGLIIEYTGNRYLTKLKWFNLEEINYDKQE